MTQHPTHLHPEVARSLEIWHTMVASKDLSNLASIVHPDAVFRSPMANSPYSSAQALILALSTVIQVFEEFAYHRELASDDGLNVVLEFSARVGDRKLKGVTDCLVKKASGWASPKPTDGRRAFVSVTVGFQK